MRTKWIMMSAMLATLVVSSAKAADTNPWRPRTSSLPQEAPAHPVPSPEAEGGQGNTYAPLDNSIPPGRAQNQYMTMPYGAPNYAPQGQYRQMPGYNGGYGNAPYLGGLSGYPGGGYPAQGFGPGPSYGGPFGGSGLGNNGWNNNGLNNGWNNNGLNNGFNNGPRSWMPFW